MAPAACVIVVTYNGAPFVRRLLDCLRAQTYRDFEVVLVDNASTDGTAAIVLEEYPEVRVVKAGANLHFARGNNEGYNASAAPIAVLLNQDTWVGHDWLERLLAPLLEDKQGAIACTHAPILNEGAAYDRSTARFSLAGTRLATLSLAGRNVETRAPLDLWSVFYGSGAGLAVRRTAAGERLFDPDYVAYAEDVALGWRLRLGGGRIRLVPEAPVHHALPPEGRPSTPELLWLWERNRLATLYVHYSTRTRWLLHPVLAADLLALALPKPAAVRPDGSVASTPPPAAAKGALGRALGRAVLDSLARRDLMAAKHREVHGAKRVAEPEVTRFMTSRLTPFDDGLLGWLNRFSLAWCRAFQIRTVESGGEAGP